MRRTAGDHLPLIVQCHGGRDCQKTTLFPLEKERPVVMEPWPARNYTTAMKCVNCQLAVQARLVSCNRDSRDKSSRLCQGASFENLDDDPRFGSLDLNPLAQ
jgi:hypothetical protein